MADGVQTEEKRPQEDVESDPFANWESLQGQILRTDENEVSNVERG